MTYKLIDKLELNQISKAKIRNYNKVDFSNLILPFKMFSDCSYIDMYEENLCYDDIILKILEEEIKTYMK